MKTIQITECKTREELFQQLREITNGPRKYMYDTKLDFVCEIDRDRATIYLQGRYDQYQEMEREKEKPAKPLYEWTVVIGTKNYTIDEGGGRESTYCMDDPTFLEFEIFPGDNGGFFARSQSNDRMCTEADDLDELKDNIIDLVRNWDNDND